MENKILSNLQNPGQLEKLYREDKTAFKQAFNTLYPDLTDRTLAACWYERLNYGSSVASRTTGKELLFVLIASLLAGLIARLPALLTLSEDFFYPRNVGFIFFPLLTAYFSWKNQLSSGKIALLTLATFISLVFINVMPDDKNSDTLILSCAHLLLFLWALLGFAFTGGERAMSEKRLGFLKYNGDLVVMTTLMLIAGGILSGITIGLFSLIGFDIAEFYFENIAVLGLAASPIIGTYLTRANPQLVGKVSPVIARIFSPLVLVMLVIYLIAVVYSGKNPYNDREFLLIFNVLLIGVMALIFFSIAETSGKHKTNAQIWVLLLLAVVTMLVNGVALSAILFRIAEWGITPNRAAVLGSNVLMLINLLLVARQLFRVISNKKELSGVGKLMATYLPVYALWSMVVTFIFPFLFGFR